MKVNNKGTKTLFVSLEGRGGEGREGALEGGK
jgi:hypothetical protein